MWGERKKKLRSLGRQRLPCLCLPALLGPSTGSWLREHILVCMGSCRWESRIWGKAEFGSCNDLGDLCRPGGHGGCTGERGRAWYDAAQGPTCAKECWLRERVRKECRCWESRRGRAPPQQKLWAIDEPNACRWFFSYKHFPFFYVLPTPCYILRLYGLKILNGVFWFIAQLLKLIVLKLKLCHNEKVILTTDLKMAGTTNYFI